jgi:hypothetical protein
MGIRLMNGCDISIYKSVLRALGSPRYILFWRCKEEKLLCITGSETKTDCSISVSDCYYKNRSGLKFRNVALYRAIAEMFDRKGTDNINLIGRALPKHQMVVFNPNFLPKEAQINEVI